MSALSIIFGLASAACWGSGDFCGGYASKERSSSFVVLTSQVVGGALFVVLALATLEPWAAPSDLAYGAGAGLFGMVGLLALYKGLAAGRMSVFAPLAAIVSLVPPAFVALFTDGLPAFTTALGFLLAVPAVWLLSSTGAKVERPAGAELRLAIIAGLGFGLFFVLIDRVSSGAVFWPLVSARVAAILALSTVVLIGRRSGTPRTEAGGPTSRTVWVAIALSGTFDAGGNAFFTLAAQAGRLDVAAVLSSLYPAMTALLAWGLLKERLAKPQWVGMCAALVALVLIAS